MQKPEWNFRWERVARALYPFVVAGCLVVMMPPVSRVAIDPGMRDVPFPRPPESITSLIAHSAAQYGLDPALLRAVIKVESNFNSEAVSSKGAIGLMQLMPLTAALEVNACFKWWLRWRNRRAPGRVWQCRLQF